MSTNHAASTSITAVVVNDDVTQLNLLKGLLGKEGLEVRTFPTAELALAEMDPHHPPGLIVTDLYMPGLDGWRFCRLLRSPDYAAFNSVPILVFSATYTGEDVTRIAAELGANAFVPAPLDNPRFRELVVSLLAGKSPRQPLRVLIVEDGRELADLLQVAFEERGYRADVALSAHSAQERIRLTAYDVAVIDYHLPDAKGIILLDAFRAERPECVCLMMTVDVGPELALECMKRGAAAYVRKPFEPAYLIELCTRARRERSLLHSQDLLEARTRELRESEQKYRVLVENAGEAIFVVQDNRFVFANTRGAQMVNCLPEQLLGEPFGRFLHVADRERVQERHEKRLRGATLPMRHEFRIISGTGQIRWAELNAVLITWKGAPATLNFLRDITDRKQTEAEREKLQAQLHHAQKMESIGRLAGGVAHDFNNMLQAIMGNISLAMEYLTPTSPVREHLDQIENCAQRSANLTRQLLAFARKQTVVPKLLDLNQTVAGMLKMLRRLIGEDIRLDWRPAANLWPVKLDPSQLDQILANLVVNARDAITDVGQITLDTRNVTFDETYVSHHPEAVPGDYVRLSVSDTGHGMDQEVQAHLFEPFFTTKTEGHGTGLGLATVYGIVQQNRGMVLVNSGPGQGTTFEIFFPRHANGTTEKPSPVKVPTSRRGTETILLVEDEPAILWSAGRILEHLGYTVLSAGTPSEALRMAENHPGGINLLLTDVVMPEMNGWDLAQRLLVRYPKLKPLFMSGYTTDVIAHHGVVDEGIQFIPKPFSAQDLGDKVRATLDEGKADSGHQCPPVTV